MKKTYIPASTDIEFPKRIRDGSQKEEFAFVELLKACTKKKDLYTGAKLHVHIQEKGLLEKSPYLASALISMYAKCHDLNKAQQILDELPIRDTFSWSALIAGYAQNGQGRLALKCFEQMQSEGISPNAITFTSILKACASIGAIDKGKEFHEDIDRRGLLRDNVVLGTALVVMYAKFGMLAKAEQVLYNLEVRDIISWNALIAGYSQHGQVEEAFKCFEQMQNEGFSPDPVTFTCILKACGTGRFMEPGKKIHDELVCRGLLKENIVLGNAVVDMYAKCGFVAKAHAVLNQLPCRDVVSWNSLIAGYAQKGQVHEALYCYEKMQRDNLSADEVTFSSILKACGISGAINKGKEIHEELLNRSFLGKNIVLDTALVDMYAKCGVLSKAEEVLNELPVRNVVTWSALIAGYVQHGYGHDALRCYEQMEREGLIGNAVTLSCILKACAITKSINFGIKIHDQIIKNSLLEKDTVLGTSLVDMYAKCGRLEKAQELMDELPLRNIVSWSALISGYVQQGNSHEALNCYDRMKSEGLSPDAAIFTCILKACVSIGAIDKGKEIHEEVAHKGLIKKDIVLGTALVDMYAKNGFLEKAKDVLFDLPLRDIVSWNALISGYAQQDQGHEALKCFELMQSEGLHPDVVTFIGVLKACGNIGAIDKGKEINDVILSMGLLDKNIVLGNALVDMYVKCGEIVKAQEVFDELVLKDTVSWNALIAGYAQQGHGHEALNCLAEMQREGLSPDEITFTSILKACGNIGAIDKGKEIHEKIVNRNLLSNNVVLGTALIDMYAKCGLTAKAQEVLDELPIRNAASWNALIAGYAQQGEGLKAFNSFQRMQKEGLIPDAVTMLCVLNGCSHSGLVHEAEKCFRDMTNKYHITPSLEHHTSMVDVFACAGHFDKAMSLIKNLQCPDYTPIWLAMLNACRKWGNVKLGKVAFDQAVKLDSNNAVYYVLMSNIYAAAGMQADAKMIEKMRVKITVHKKQGQSIEVT